MGYRDEIGNTIYKPVVMTEAEWREFERRKREAQAQPPAPTPPEETVSAWERALEDDD
jgi:hypothetical protein